MWLAPSTMVKFHCSCCLTSAQLSTPWIIKFYCKYYPNALLWPTPHSAGSALTLLTAHNSSHTLAVVHPVSQWTVVCHTDRYYGLWNSLFTRKILSARTTIRHHICMLMILNLTPAVDPKISTTSEHVSGTASPISHSGAPHVVFSSSLIKQKRSGMGRAPT